MKCIRKDWEHWLFSFKIFFKLLFFYHRSILLCLINIGWVNLYFILMSFSFLLKYKFIYFNWRLITSQYCIGFAIHQHVSALESTLTIPYWFSAMQQCESYILLYMHIYICISPPSRVSLPTPKHWIFLIFRKACCCFHFWVFKIIFPEKENSFHSKLKILQNYDPQFLTY